MPVHEGKVASRGSESVTKRNSRIGRPSAKTAPQIPAQILAAASGLFATQGYRAVSMRQVADAAQVSTRTLYNHFADKEGLFAACLDSGAAAFPVLQATPGIDVQQALRDYALALVRMLSEDASLRLGLLTYREGGDFPELPRAAEAISERHILQPVAAFLQATGIAGDAPQELARLFISLALSEWYRLLAWRHPLRQEDLARHAELATSIFLDGARGRRQRPLPAPARARRG